MTAASSNGDKLYDILSAEGVLGSGSASNGREGVGLSTMAGSDRRQQQKPMSSSKQPKIAPAPSASPHLSAAIVVDEQTKSDFVAKDAISAIETRGAQDAIGRKQQQQPKKIAEQLDDMPDSAMDVVTCHPPSPSSSPDSGAVESMLSPPNSPMLPPKVGVVSSSNATTTSASSSSSSTGHSSHSNSKKRAACDSETTSTRDAVAAHPAPPPPKKRKKPVATISAKSSSSHSSSAPSIRKLESSYFSPSKKPIVSSLSTEHQFPAAIQVAASQPDCSSSPPPPSKSRRKAPSTSTSSKSKSKPKSKPKTKPKVSPTDQETTTTTTVSSASSSLHPAKKQKKKQQRCSTAAPSSTKKCEGDNPENNSCSSSCSSSSDAESAAEDGNNAGDSSSSSSSEEPVRHSPGYALLRVERDRIARAIVSLRKKNEHRVEAAGGKKPPPTVCSILNDALLEFYIGVQQDFNAKFSRYLS